MLRIPPPKAGDLVEGDEILALLAFDGGVTLCGTMIGWEIPATVQIIALPVAHTAVTGDEIRIAVTLPHMATDGVFTAGVDQTVPVPAEHLAVCRGCGEIAPCRHVRQEVAAIQFTRQIEAAERKQIR